MRPAALASAPWPLFNRPSIQMACLKAFAQQRLPELRVDCRHLYLSVAEALSSPLYEEISQRTWLGECLYAGLLYPERSKTLETFWRRRISPGSRLRGLDFNDLCQDLHQISGQVLDRVDWGRYGLVGFSICLGQLLSSLYFIREMKRRVPETIMVVGGSSCGEEMGLGLLHAFPEIDGVVSGEGELPFLHLLSWVGQGLDLNGIPPFPGVFVRGQAPGPAAISQVESLDDLPIPDYRDYFRHLYSLSPEHRFFPRLPIETSRGCWWRDTARPGRPSGCAFCNLNLQWKGYRAKGRDRVVGEIKTLSNTYQSLSLSFMDNLLPPKGLAGLFREVKGLGKDFHLFAEIRATVSEEGLGAMAQAGVYHVQAGIEALSTSLLRKLNKGTRAVDNIEIMKNCETPGLPVLNANLILGFPSSDQGDVEETLRNLEFVLPFRPLKGIWFWLGYGSPVWKDFRAYGIRTVGNHPFYRYLFPKEILQGLRLMVQGYKGGLKTQQGLWGPVKRRLAQWRKNYLHLHPFPNSGPILSFQDGGDFLIIRERRPGGHDFSHRLRGSSRKIYLYCSTKRSMKTLVSAFPGLGEDRIRPFLQMMVEKRLMFQEGDWYLGLAVPMKRGSLKTAS